MKTHLLIKVSLVLSAVVSQFSFAQSTLTLENLERERAAMISNFISDQLTHNQQQSKMNNSYRRLTDIERMVLRDDRLLSNQSAIVQRAFKSYELTFLVHASAEHNILPMDLWLSQLNISTEQVLATKKGRR